MNITMVSVTTTAEEKTDNAVYVLEYTVTNGTLVRASANIMEPGHSKASDMQSVGMIYLEQDIVTCNLPKDRDLAPYFTDFDNLLKTIHESTAQPAN